MENTCIALQTLPEDLHCQFQDQGDLHASLSSTMTEGKIVSWVKSEGDVISKGESVVVVESDKADMDVEIFYDGILAAIVIHEVENALVGDSHCDAGIREQ